MVYPGKKKSYGLEYSIIIVVVMLSTMLLFMPIYCRLQLLAANTSPMSVIGKQYVLIGIVAYMIVYEYKTLIAVVSTLPIRMRLEPLKKIVRHDVKYIYLPMALFTVIVLIVYWYLLWSSTLGPDPATYIQFTSMSMTLMIALSIYIVVYGIPASVVCCDRRDKLFFGLSASILPSVIALITAFFLSLFPVFLYYCSAAALGIEVFNRNTRAVELASSVDLGGIVSLLIWYILYANSYRGLVREVLE